MLPTCTHLLRIFFGAIHLNHHNIRRLRQAYTFNPTRVEMVSHLSLCYRPEQVTCPLPVIRDMDILTHTAHTHAHGDNHSVNACRDLPHVEWCCVRCI